LVLGHERCGAVTAALSPVQERAKEWQGIQKLLTHIDPALQDIDPSLSLEQKIHFGVEANVRWSIQQLGENPELSGKMNNDELIIAGGVYELKAGKVRILP
jgi:carbonic anhydrase